jgi:hypothetical protein
MIGEMFYRDIDNDLWQFELHTTPPEALYWTNYKIKLEDIKIISKADKHIRNRIRTEILKDINVTPNIKENYYEKLYIQ